MVTALSRYHKKTTKMCRYKKSRSPLPYQVLNRLQRGFLRWRCIAYLDQKNRLQSKRTNNEFVS